MQSLNFRLVPVRTWKDLSEPSSVQPFRMTSFEPCQSQNPLFLLLTETQLLRVTPHER
jgi:hypothetical protein